MKAMAMTYLRCPDILATLYLSTSVSLYTALVPIEQSKWYEAVQANWRIEGWTVNFIMTSAAFRSLCVQLKPYVKKKSTNYRDYICVPICVAISLYFCAVQLNTG